MAISIQAEAPPVREDSTGALRVGNTRVLVELVLAAFKQGATPETIMQRYPSLALSEVYSIIAYYLKHPEELDKYMGDRAKTGDEMQRKIEASQTDMSQLRARLLARRAS